MADTARKKWIENYMKKNNVSRNTAAAEYRLKQREGVRATSAAKAKVLQNASNTLDSPAAKALETARKLKGPLEFVGRNARRAASIRGQLGLAAVSVAGPKILKLGEDMRKQNEGKRVPTSSITKAEKSLGQRMGKKATASKPVKASKRADSADSARTPKPLTKAQQRGSMGLTGASYTVKKGDSLWKIAQDNNTTVSALLKANPTIAKRKASGKTTIYSGSKVRIPGKK